MRYIVFFIFTTISFAQQISIDSISYEYFFEKELKYIVQLKKKQLNQPFNPKLNIKIAETYKKINCEDSAYAVFYKVYEHQKEENTLSVNEFQNLLFNLHVIESSKKKYHKDRRYFLKKLQEISTKSKSDKWQAKIDNELFKDYFGDSLKLKLAQEKIRTIKKSNYYKTNSEFRSLILLNEGNLNTKLNNFTDAENGLFKALNLAVKNKDYLRQVYCLINLGANENKRGNYNIALDYFKQIDDIPNENYKLKIARILSYNRGNSYYGLKDAINLKFQDNLYSKLDSLIADFQKNSNFYEIDVAFQTKEKDKKIKELSTLQASFKKNKIIYGLLLFLVFLLALYSFVRWKKTDKKKELLNKENETLNLENEKTKTELETVKSLVINDYIVLKNKTKVYLDVLIYIKSDGHYLNLYTTSKKEFVRGKISEIEKQLPPNFIKCHRSYIANENFIKQYSSTEIFMINGETVPLSRGFKF